MKIIQRLIHTALIAACLAGLFLAPGEAGNAAPEQIGIPLAPPYSQDFSIGTSATATLPTDWRVDRDNTNVRTVGTYAAAGTATALRAGNNMSSSATNGIYNYAAGDPTTSTERAVGFISSGSGTFSGNLYASFQNNTGAQINELWIQYNVEKYRRGFNPANFSIQMYYSSDGSSWTSAGANFLTSFPSDGVNSGYTPAPGVTVEVSNTLPVNIPNGGSFYLAWNYSVATGTTTTSAQGLGIDDFYIQANDPTAVTLGGFHAASFAGLVRLNWQTLHETNTLGFNLYRCPTSLALPDASCTRLNQTIIAPKALGQPNGASYVYSDASLPPGHSFDYWLEALNLDGVQRFGPLQVTGTYGLLLPFILRSP